LDFCRQYHPSTTNVLTLFSFMAMLLLYVGVIAGLQGHPGDGHRGYWFTWHVFNGKSVVVYACK